MFVNQFRRFVDPSLCFAEMITAYSEYLRIAEEEQTNREKIRAWAQINIDSIQSQRDVIINFLNHSFDERAKNFDNLFKCVDMAVSNKDNEQLSLLLTVIVELAKVNPLTNLQEFQAKFDDPDYVWEF
jgi:hypothetical protein